MHATTKIIIWILFPATLIFGVAGFIFITNQQIKVTADVLNLDNPIIIPADDNSQQKNTEDFVLTIEKLAITAPMIENVSGTDEKEYLKAIENGVAHYAGTPLPGNVGNSFIFGHSSYYKNKPGNYKEIFKQLDQLKTGDSIAITKGEQTFIYQVTVSKIIEPTDTSILDQTEEEIITLMTCWPPGTINKRYIVQAQRVNQN